MEWDLLIHNRDDAKSPKVWEKKKTGKTEEKEATGEVKGQRALKAVGHAHGRLGLG